MHLFALVTFSLMVDDIARFQEKIDRMNEQTGHLMNPIYDDEEMKKKNVSGLRLTIHQMSLTKIDFVKYVVLFL